MEMNNDNMVHTLWIGEELSAMEVLTLKSFSDCGFSVQLWCYNKNIIVPDGIIKKDANEIIEESSVFHYTFTNKFGHGKGSVSGFSDVFRYKLLYELGGIWADMDITCLQPFVLKDPYFFRHHHQIGIVGNFLKSPKKSPLMKWCYEQSSGTVNEKNTDWLLPVEILKEGIYKFKLEQYIQNISNQDSFPKIRGLLLHNKIGINNWKIIHWMNEELRRLNIDKNVCIKGSAYEALLIKYAVDHKVATSGEAKEIKQKISALRYIILNLKARWKWYLKSINV